MRGATTTSTPRHPPRVLSGAEGAANARDREAMLISGGDNSSVTSRIYRVRVLPSPRESQKHRGLYGKYVRAQGSTALFT